MSGITQHDVALSLLFAGWVILVLCFTEWMVSRLNGWGRLAKLFGCPGRFSGERHRFQSGRLNAFYFRWSMEVAMNEKGLYLVPMIPLRLFHKPLLIPWDEIEAKPYHKFVNRGYQLSLRSAPETTLVLFGEAFRNSEKFMERAEN